MIKTERQDYADQMLAGKIESSQQDVSEWDTLKYKAVEITQLTPLQQLIVKFSRPVVGVGSLLTIVALIIWASLRYEFAPTIYGLRTVAKLMLLSIAISILARVVLMYMLRTEMGSEQSDRYRIAGIWRPLFLLDINAPLYLAVGVLTNIPAAVMTALVAQIPLQIYTAFRRLCSWTEACYRVASIALAVGISGKIYKFIAGPPHDYRDEVIYHVNEFLGATFGATVMLVLLVIMLAPLLMWQNYQYRRAPLQTKILAPLMFQALLLSVGPLLPILDAFGNGWSELAWMLFLGPLFAIYYLALTNTRLDIKTFQLQHTLLDLGNTRRRRDELHDYASLITRAQEDERRRLARELHDDTAQALVALSLGLDGLGSAIEKLHPSQKDRDWLSHLRKLTDDTLEGVRRACQDLRPSILDNLGLKAAIEWLADNSVKRGVFCLCCSLGEAYKLSPEVETAIFRIVQEALSNVWKHAQANYVYIELHYQPEQIVITITDNGKGFSSNHASPMIPNRVSGGMGVIGMRERARLIGATLNITSAPRAGCTIQFVLPNRFDFED